MATSSKNPKGTAGQAGQSSEEGGQRGLVRLPAVHVPHVRMPAGTAGHLLWWGGLAAVAAFGVVDWPVAAVVAAGSWVAEQYAKQAAQRPDDKAEAAR